MRFVRRLGGSQMEQSPIRNHLLCAEQAEGVGVVRMVIGGQQHIESGVLQGVHHGVRAVESGIAGIRIAVIISGQCCLQIGHGKIRLSHVISDVGKEIVKTVGVSLQSRLHQRPMGQNVPCRQNGRPRDFHIGLGFFRFRRQRLLCPLRQSSLIPGRRVLPRIGSVRRPVVQPDGSHRQNDQQTDRRRQKLELSDFLLAGSLRSGASAACPFIG